MDLSTTQLTPIADRIDAHLKRFEADPVSNAEQLQGGMRTTPFFHARAVAMRKRVYVQYVAYQDDTRLSADEAVSYLAWLDAGNVGTHYAARPS